MIARRRKPGVRARQSKRRARDRLAPIIPEAVDGLAWLKAQERRFLARRQLRKQIEAEQQENGDLIDKRKSVSRP
jgi:hypothetical protein